MTADTSFCIFMSHSYGAKACRHQTKGDVTFMAIAIDTRQTDFSEMDDAGISKEHWKIMLISGMGFFTDAYDLFVIGVVMALLKPMWHVGKVEEGLVESRTWSAASASTASKSWFSPQVQSPVPSLPISGGLSDFVSFSASELA